MAAVPEITLHTFFRSSSTGRLRIALGLKNIPYKSIYVNLGAGEQFSEAYKALNPSQTVPLFVHSTSLHGVVSIGQSLAALEYLEEAFPARLPLLPPSTDLEGRAYVRTLANIIVSDTQPVTSLRLLKRVEGLGGDRLLWAKEMTAIGLTAYEAVVQQKAGKYSYGDQITIADACLTTAVWNAYIYGVNMEDFPTILGIFKRMSEQPAVIKAHWKNQDDCTE
jgi:maleylacetoacetate isomerase